ncbi:MAG: protein disulfide oxidoreductase [bacterium]
MSLIQESVKSQIDKNLKSLPNPVRLVVFTQEMECQFCRENRQLAEEVAALSDKIKLEVYNFLLDKEKVEEFKVERVPALVVAGEKDHGIRFYGVPAGYEFTSLVNAIQLVGSGESGLKPNTKEKLAQIDQPVKIDVFVTLTCPYCPMMVSLAHRFAMESEKITASAIDAQEFPVLANYYDVMAVPKTVLNQRNQFEGALPEERFLEEVLKVVGTGAVNA